MVEAPKRQRGGGADPYQLALQGQLDAVIQEVTAQPSLLAQPKSGGLYDGRHLLHCAASMGHRQLVLKLLKLGAEPAVHDKRGMTPAELARKQGYHELADLLDEAFDSVQEELASMKNSSTVRGTTAATTSPTQKRVEMQASLPSLSSLPLQSVDPQPVASRGVDPPQGGFSQAVEGEASTVHDLVTTEDLKEMQKFLD